MITLALIAAPAALVLLAVLCLWAGYRIGRADEQLAARARHAVARLEQAQQARARTGARYA